MDPKKILIQLDSDPHASVFDRVVAVDSGVDHLFSYGGVKPEHVQGLVHGAIFTRSPSKLKNTAIFAGGSDVSAGEKLMAEALKHMIPSIGLRVSILLDANGANTTAAAAVRSAAKHLTLRDCPALVLGGTGPVGQRVARLLAREGALVRVGSRQAARAEGVCRAIREKIPDARLTPVGCATSSDAKEALAGVTLVVAAGAAGAVLLPQSIRASAKELQVAIDLNAVEPLGIEGIAVHDKAKTYDGVVCYGAVGVGDTKMRIHRAAVAKLFESNDQIMDAEEVYQLACSL